MRSISIATIATLAATFNGAVAWDQSLCNGAGGCMQVTWFPNAGFSCPDGSSLTNSKVAQALTTMNNGGYEVITAANFPKSCLGNRAPTASQRLVVHKTANDAQKVYGFLSETCTESAPAPDCYNQNPNPSGLTLCQITTPDERNCAQGPSGS